MKRENNDCLTQCVAKYFGLNPNRVPFFVSKKNYGKYLRAFFKRRGLRIDWEFFDEKLLCNKRKLYIVVGVSPRKFRGKKVRHAVLYKGIKPYYDPNTGGLFLKKPEHIWIVKKITSKKNKPSSKSSSNQ